MSLDHILYITILQYSLYTYIYNTLANGPSAQSQKGNPKARQVSKLLALAVNLEIRMAGSESTLCFDGFSASRNMGPRNQATSNGAAESLLSKIRKRQDQRHSLDHNC